MHFLVYQYDGIQVCYIDISGRAQGVPRFLRDGKSDMAINRVNIMGNLTRDAELRKSEGGAGILSFSVAVNEKRRDPETDAWVDCPVFVDCAVFGKRAEALAPYLTKGQKVSIDGKLRYHSWMENDKKRHALSVVVAELEFAGGKTEKGGRTAGEAQSQAVAAPELYDEDIPF